MERVLALVTVKTVFFFTVCGYFPRLDRSVFLAPAGQFFGGSFPCKTPLVTVVTPTPGTQGFSCTVWAPRPPSRNTTGSRTKSVATPVAFEFEFQMGLCKNFPGFFSVGGAPTTQLFGGGLAGKRFLETVAAPTTGTRT